MNKMTSVNNLETDTGDNGSMPATDHDFVFDSDDTDSALDKATSEVLSGLSDKKKREQVEKRWGDRPEHLRKSLGQMSESEKHDYYLWKAGEWGKPEKQNTAPAAPEPVRYTETMVKRTGKMILRFFARRMPVKKEVSGEEIDSFAEIFTPLANKYLGGVGNYQEELAGGMFLLSFFGERIGKDAATE